nr:MAG TPA: hypothetical protein [Caudoviricetes sp.]
MTFLSYVIQFKYQFFILSLIWDRIKSALCS